MCLWHPANLAGPPRRKSCSAPARPDHNAGARHLQSSIMTSLSVGTVCWTRFVRRPNHPHLGLTSPQPRPPRTGPTEASCSCVTQTSKAMSGPPRPMPPRSMHGSRSNIGSLFYAILQEPRPFAKHSGRAIRAGCRCEGSFGLDESRLRRLHTLIILRVLREHVVRTQNCYNAHHDTRN